MSIKTFALAAAAVAITATAASANSFGFQESVEDRNSINVELVKAEGAGTLSIYNLQGGERGALLGATMVSAGANGDVRVNVGNTYKTDVLAVLSVNGQEVASEAFDVR